MLQHIELHGIVEDLNKLQLNSEYGTWGDSDIQAWEMIDHLLVLGRTAAENKCPQKSLENTLGHQTRTWPEELFCIGSCDFESSPAETRT